MSTLVTPNQPALAPPLPLLTAEEFVQRCGHLHAELVKGVVQELPMPFLKHGKICSIINYRLTDYVLKHDRGHVMSNDSFVKTKTNPDTVRGADVCYFSYERLPRGDIPEGLLPNLPDLVVEVRSPSDSWSEIFIKIGEYLGAGVRVVIVLDAGSTTASVYRAEELQQIFHNGDELVVPDVLPGFTAVVRQLFE